MIPRILSVAAPLFVYVTFAVLVFGIWQARRKLEWLSLVPAAFGLIASFLFVPSVHRLFFDEDIYISIASNLRRAPVAQVTVLGGPDNVEVSSYYKSPVGWPLLLSLVFLLTGRSEVVAFIAARILFAIAIAAVYHLAREILSTKRQALVAAVLFGATPVCFWFSVSAGTDIPAALFVTLGFWGLCVGNGALAAAGFALAAQTRMELIVLVPLILLSKQASLKWKAGAFALIAVEIVHVAWVMSVAPVLAEAEKVTTTFSAAYVAGNVTSNLRYLLSPSLFPAAITVLAIVGALQNRKSLPSILSVQCLLLLVVYFFFYAGSFDLNPRYSIQILGPLAVLAASAVKRPVWIAVLMLSIPVAYTQRAPMTGYLRALEADHRISVQFASQLKPNDLVVSTEPEMFLNQGISAMSAVFASERKARLEEELRRRGKAWYHEGARTNVVDSLEWRTARWGKSNFELHPIDSNDVNGMRIAFYEILPKLIDREARLRSPLERESHCCELGRVSGVEHDVMVVRSARLIR